MNQALVIATPILAALVTARPSGNIVTQAAEALDRADALLRLAESRGIDTTDDRMVINYPSQAGPAAPVYTNPVPAAKRKA